MPIAPVLPEGERGSENCGVYDTASTSLLNMLLQTSNLPANAEGLYRIPAHLSSANVREGMLQHRQTQISDHRRDQAPGVQVNLSPHVDLDSRHALHRATLFERETAHF